MLDFAIWVAMACSMLTAALMGTIIPMPSKRPGFDPATATRPSETAFQAIIAFRPFLGLATLTANRITQASQSDPQHRRAR